MGALIQAMARRTGPWQPPQSRRRSHHPHHQPLLHVWHAQRSSSLGPSIAVASTFQPQTHPPATENSSSSQSPRGWRPPLKTASGHGWSTRCKPIDILPEFSLCCSTCLLVSPIARALEMPSVYSVLPMHAFRGATLHLWT